MKHRKPVSYTHLDVYKRQVYGGRSPKGFDCSGLTSYVFEKNGITLPRTATPQYAMGTKVAKSDLQVGDLVFFGGKRIEHVGIYVGDGNFIHSPSPGKSVRIETLMSGYYSCLLYTSCDAVDPAVPHMGQNQGIVCQKAQAGCRTHSVVTLFHALLVDRFVCFKI